MFRTCVKLTEGEVPSAADGSLLSSFAGEGECELRQLYEASADANCASTANRAEVALKA
jgi:hypothetical protein